MSALSIRRRLRRHRRHVALIATVVVLVGMIAAHHTGLVIGMQHSAGIGAAAVEMCLGILTAVGAALLAVAVMVVALGRRRPLLVCRAAAVLMTSPVPVARARHGPAVVSVLCVSRR